MAIGPVQLLVLGFDHPDFQGGDIEITRRLKEMLGPSYDWSRGGG